jgi:hypothetical protein
MLLPPPPFIRLLLATKAALEAVDYEDLAGFAVTVRHHRGRHPSAGELPALSILFDENEIDGEDSLTSYESGNDLKITLQADKLLDPEDQDLDPTGLLGAGRMLAAGQIALIAEGGPLIPLLCDWVSSGAIALDEDSSADLVRVTQEFTVRYRTLTLEPNTLLAMGEQP